MTTVRKLSKSVPRHLSLVLGRTCRNVHVVSLPRRQPSASSRRSPSPSAFVAAVPSLRWGLRAVTLATRYRRSRSASLLRLPLVDASEMSSSRRRTSAAPIPASWPATALQSLSQAIPPRV